MPSTPNNTPTSPDADTDSEAPAEHKNFIELEVEKDLASKRFDGRVTTRFPPEPNGYLHIGHAKAIGTSYGIAQRYGGHMNLRFDDTNPAKEEQEFVDAIREDMRWLGFDWGDNEFYASDYFEQLYGFAEQLVGKGLAFVCDLNAAEMREYRGTITSPGKDSPNRERSVEENMDLLRRMRAAEFEDGTHTLRVKIDMSSPNLNMRDPVLYRIARAHHHRTGDTWCIYPMYDFAHGQSDAIEEITHSLCSLEFENHRPLYEWFLANIDGIAQPRQIEFARLNPTYTITSKRKLQTLVADGHVSGWDDPRMPTIRGLRKRGYTPEAIRSFCDGVGVTKFNASHDLTLLENALRNDLNERALRRMAVLDPLKIVITNLGEDESIECAAVNNPQDPNTTTRPIHLTREVWVERDDFREDPPKKFFRLRPDGQVRLRFGYVVRCDEVVKNDAGEVVELRCTYDARTAGGVTPEGEKKVKGVIHWVSGRDAVDAEVRLYDHLFSVPRPGADGRSIEDDLNPDSLRTITVAKLEPVLADADAGERVQFERLGYFVRTDDEALTFNRAVTLRDSWAKIEKKGG